MPVSKQPVETLQAVKSHLAEVTGETVGAGVTAGAVENVVGVRVAAALVVATEEVGQMGKNVLQVIEILVNGLIARILSHSNSAVIITDITIMVSNLLINWVITQLINLYYQGFGIYISLKCPPSALGVFHFIFF